MLTREEQNRVDLLTLCEADLKTQCSALDPADRNRAEELIRAFLSGRQRMQQLQYAEENQTILSEKKPKAEYLLGVAHQGIFGKGGTVMPSFAKMDALNRVGDYAEKEDPDAWGSGAATEEQLKKAETELSKAAGQLWDFLAGFAQTRAVLEDGSHIREVKYQDAIELTMHRKTGEDDYCRGMEYFARLDTYKDSAKRFAVCNNMLFFAHSKMVLFVPILIAVLTIFLYVYSYGINNAAVWITYEKSPLDYFWDSIPWALFFAAVSYGVVEIILLIAMLVRKAWMKRRLRYSGHETEWTFL